MHGANGVALGITWALPFGGLLLSIALAPLVAAGAWHRHYGKIAAFWSVAFVLPFAVVYGASAAAEVIYQEFGVTGEAVAAAAKSSIAAVQD